MLKASGELGAAASLSRIAIRACTNVAQTLAVSAFFNIYPRRLAIAANLSNIFILIMS
jgi:hypothetical protein